VLVLLYTAVEMARRALGSTDARSAMDEAAADLEPALARVLQARHVLLDRARRVGHAAPVAGGGSPLDRRPPLRTRDASARHRGGRPAASSGSASSGSCATPALRVSARWSASRAAASGRWSLSALLILVVVASASSPDL
jgi:hypothetical protein